MNADAPSDDRGRELVPDDWRALDDTLAEGPAPAEVPVAARSWLADQRLLHGLLRALHTPDAAAREGRIEAVLQRIDAAATAEPRRRWSLVALAALLLAGLLLWLQLPAKLPTAEAAVERAVAELARDVARRYRLELSGPVLGGTGPAAREPVTHEFALVTQPGARFRIDGKLAFGALQFGDLRVGADGEELWIASASGLLRKSVPLAEHERLLQGFGDLLDIGYLDLHDLVRRLPEACELRVIGRQRDAAGRMVLQIEAVRRTTAPQQPHVQLACDEATGMVTRLEAWFEFARGARRAMVFEYLGEEPPGLVDFRRPW